MRIFADIGHPAHVHYFRNFIRKMQERGHEFFISARRKECSHQLLDNYGFTYFDRGKGGEGAAGKILYTIKADSLIYGQAKKFNPDLFMSFCTPYLSHVAKLMGKHAIVIDDSDHSKLNHMMYRAFASTILTPVYFQRDFGDKHVRFNGYFESIYLHPDYFRPEKEIIEKFIASGDEYALLRFVSWNANHDMYGQNKGLTNDEKTTLVKKLSEKMKVFITSELPLPPHLEKFRLSIPPEHIHHFMAYASLFIGESLTMASEAALLGTPSICISTAKAGTLEDQKKRGLIHSFENTVNLYQCVNEIINDNNYKERFKIIPQTYFRETINVTAFLIWFTENYPESKMILDQYPDYQFNFR